MRRKALRGGRVEVKDADRGEVRAVFARLNVVDHDGDVTLPGAFVNGAAVRISAFGHASWGGALPVGRGTIREIGDEAILDGQFFMDTTAGRDTFATVKGLGELGEWSYGFDVLDGGPGTFEGEAVNFLHRLDVHEVSPVLKGAGVDTRTLAVKSAAFELVDLEDRFREHEAALHEESPVDLDQLERDFARRVELFDLEQSLELREALLDLADAERRADLRDLEREFLRTCRALRS